MRAPRGCKKGAPTCGEVGVGGRKWLARVHVEGQWLAEKYGLGEGIGGKIHGLQGSVQCLDRKLKFAQHVEVTFGGATQCGEVVADDDGVNTAEHAFFRAEIV